MDSNLEKTYTIAEARSRLPALVHQAESGEPIRLTRRGRPVAVLLSLADYQALARPDSDWWTQLEALRLAGGLSEGGFTSEETDSLRSPDPGRPVEL